MSSTWFLCLLALVACEERGPKAKQNVEFYDKVAERYAIYLDRVIFEEAKHTCIAIKGSLVEYHNKSVAEFVTRCLAESAVGLSSVWIGGQYTPATASDDGDWRWLSGREISTEPLGIGESYPMKSPPYWAAKPDVRGNVSACLVADRVNHTLPMVGAISCYSNRPFVCVVPLNPPTGPVEVAPGFMSNGKRFHLFETEFTWGEALGFCHSQGFRLGAVTEPSEFIKLQNRMERARPTMENVWTSGAFVEGKWMWVTSNEEISTSVENVKVNACATCMLPDCHVSACDANATQTCLLADCHMSDYFVYLEAQCDMRRSVLCVEDLVSEPDMFKKLNGTNLFVSTHELPWLDAKKMCETCLEGGSLLQLATNNETLLKLQTEWLYRAMTDVTREEIKHIWLNARLQGDVFSWARDPQGKSPEEFKYPIDRSQLRRMAAATGAREAATITLCPEDPRADVARSDHECLNLDRESLRQFFMYGLSCDITQRFMCTASDNQPSLFQETCRKLLV